MLALEIANAFELFLIGLYPIFAHHFMKKEYVLYIAHVFNSAPFNEVYLKACMKMLAHDLHFSNREMHTIIRLMMTGQENGPDFYKMIMFLGKETVIQRFFFIYENLKRAEVKG